MRRAARGLEWWMAVAVAVIVGLAAAAIASQAAVPARAQEAGAGFELSVNQLRINQRISQAAVRRSNDALTRLGVVEPAVTALVASGGKEGPRGPQGPQGATGAQGPAGPQGPAGSAAAFAQVQQDGDVVESRSQGIADANVSKPVPGVGIYCFSGLGFVPKAMVATGSGSTPHVVTVNMPAPSGQVDGCGVGEPSVLVHGLAGGAAVDAPFFVWFED